ncbi:MAG TPA: hypothetical protein VIY47_15105 [Ignavibacteriaceae bacterium]
MKAVKTKISVLDMNMFQQFLDYHEIKGVFVGFYGLRVNPYQTDNYIQYVYDDDSDTVGGIVTLSLIHGSLEKAFLKARYPDDKITYKSNKGDQN